MQTSSECERNGAPTRRHQCFTRICRLAAHDPKNKPIRAGL